MTSLLNPNSYSPPVPVVPVAPNFVFCSGAYGTGLKRYEAVRVGGLLPQGTLPVTYLVQESDTDGLPANASALERAYRLPFLESFGGVSISIDVSGPVNIDRINVVPNDIRGMAAYVANQCPGRGGLGGFITKKIQGLVDFVTDPTSDINVTIYPDYTAFLTLTVSSHQSAFAFPGDYDPAMALFLQRAEIHALSRVQPSYQRVIADRAKEFAIARSRMRRLGTDVTWWGGTNSQLTNTTTEVAATARRRKRAPGRLH